MVQFKNDHYQIHYNGYSIIFTIKKLIEMEQLSTLYRDIIRKNNLSHLTITLRRVKNIKYVIKHYNFIKYDFNSSNITDKSVKLLGNCHTLDLSYCHKITDESVKFLGNYHTLNLSDCDQITDESVKLLGNCHILNLSYCDQITDKSVKFLGNCHTLNLSGCKKITDESVKFLGKCHNLIRSPMILKID